MSVDGSTSSDAEGPISSYAWNFGDTATGTGVTASHTYAAAGTYNVTLTVTDSGGLTGTATHAVTVAASPPPPPPSNAVTKVLVFMEENHSLNEMKSGMPYDFSLAQQYGYATNYKGITHPSLPNYLAIAGGTTAGVTDDSAPSSHPINASSVFGQAITAGHTAKSYAESMTSNCQLTSSGAYAVKHNPWAYYTPSTERTPCNANDVPETALAGDITNGNLPTVGMVIPNLNNDAHDGTLATADNWLKTRMQQVFAGPDWQSGHLAVIITADEDDSSQSNLVLTTVVHPSQSGHVVSTALNHYSLTRLLEDVAHTSHLANAATAADMASAFGLVIG
jgi:phosphatidylinositol-3-phosphatase